MRNLVFITLDSCRYDSWTAAEPKTLARLGPVERRYSFATWTAPSHYNLLTGLIPHTSPPHVFASEYYKEDFLRYSERLGVEGIEFKRFLPHLWLPTFLKEIGYRTHAMVSLPVLNPLTGINRDFDTFELMPSHNDMAAMVDQMHFDDDQPAFYMLNVGETHYPYALPHEDPKDWPRISGVHGVFKHMGDPGARRAGAVLRPGAARRAAPAPDRRRHLPRRERLPALFDKLPPETWLVRHRRPRRAVRRGGLLRARADPAPEGHRGALRRGPRALVLQRVLAVEVELELDDLVALEAEHAAASCSTSTPSRCVTPRKRTRMTTRSPRSKMSS